MTMSTILPVDADYTNRDHASLRARILSIIPSVFPEWSETSKANFGNILAELPAHTGDVLSYYLDKAARESRISTAQLRKSLLGLVKLIGYRPAGATAATVTETFTLAAPMAGTLTIPAGRKVATAEVTAPVKFQLLDDLVFAAGETVKTATVEHSEFATDSFQSSTQPSQRFALRRSPYLDGSAVVSAANGDYTVVLNFLDSTSMDRHVVVVIDANDKATLRFGTGTNGQIPQGTINVAYKTGGGSTGRLEANKLVKLEGAPYHDALGNTARVSVNNAAKTDGGDDRESNERIRFLAPQSLRVLERAVAREDFEIAALTVSGVARALMLTSNQDAAIQENTGILFIVPTSGGAPSQALLDAVLALFTSGAGPGLYPKANTFNVLAQTALYQPVDVQAKIFKRQGSTAAAVKAAIQSALTSFFSVSLSDGTPNSNVDFGFNLKSADGAPASEIAFSDIYNVVRDAGGVRKIGDGPSDFLLNGLTVDVAVGNWTFPVLGTITIIDGDTGLTL